MRKICNNCRSEQDIFSLGGKNYCVGCNNEINMDSGQISAQKQKSLHKMKVALDTLYNVLEPLEEYIEKTGNYPGFISKRQIYRKTIKDSEGPLENDEDLFLSNLYIFARTFHGKPSFFMEVVQGEFYKWINAVGITADNCHEELKHFLIEVNSVLNGNDEKIIRETQERIKDVEIDPKMMVEIFAGLQNPLNKNRQQRKELEGKKWSELSEEDRLKGDADLGRQEFERIKGSVSIPHENFRLRYFGEKRLIQRIKNPNYKPFIDDPSEEFLDENDWEIRKNFAISCDGRKRGDVLARKGAKIGGQDYDIITGELINQPDKVYRQDYFSDNEKVRIALIFPVSIVNWELVDNIKKNSNLEKGLFVLLNRETSERSEGESWFVHKQLEREIDSKTGYLIYVPNFMIRVKDLNEEEQKELGYKLETTHQTQIQQGNHPQGGNGGGSGWGRSYVPFSIMVISLAGLFFTR